MPATSTINAFMTREDLSKGQAVASYALQYKDASTGDWTPIKVWLCSHACMHARSDALSHPQVNNGLTVGNKVIDLLNTTTLTNVPAVRFVCNTAVRSDVYIRDFAAFYVTPPS